MDDPKFQEFITTQNQCYDRVLAELAAGRKETHWIWFIFPQVAGLGLSATSQQFALASREEARRYYYHPVLGSRLLHCLRLVLAVPDRTIDQIFGYPDNLKFRSCLTLFAAAVPEEPLFAAALSRYFDGSRDPLTLKIIESSSPR